MNNDFDTRDTDDTVQENREEKITESAPENSAEAVPECDCDPIKEDTGEMPEETAEEIIFDEVKPIAVDIAKEKRNFSRLGLGLAVFGLTVLLSSFLLQMLVLYLVPDFYHTALFRNMLSPVCIYAIALPVLMIFIGGMEKSAPEKKHMGFGAWLLILIIGFGFMYIGSYLGNGLMELFSAAANYDYSNALDSLIDYDTLWITAIFMVIVAPIGEEFIFRKLIIDRTRKYGGIICVLISGLSFGLMHGNFYQFFYAFALGCILGYVYYSTGRIWLTVAIHAVINFVGGILTAYMQRGLDAYMADMEALEEGAADLSILIKHGGTLMAMFAYILFTFAAMICAIVLPIVLRKRIKLGRGEVELPEFKKYSTVFGNVGMILMIVVFGLEFLLNLIPV